MPAHAALDHGPIEDFERGEHGLTQSMSDQDQLVTLVDGIERNLGRKPKEASADAGYCSKANLGALADRGI